jgi:hypothetical protein
MQASKTLILGGIEGKNLDTLADALVANVPKEQWSDLRYVLNKALQATQDRSGWDPPPPPKPKPDPDCPAVFG